MLAEIIHWEIMISLLIVVERASEWGWNGGDISPNVITVERAKIKQVSAITGNFPSSIAAVAGATEARIILCIVRLIRHNYLSVFIKFLIYLVGFSTFRAVHIISTSAAAVQCCSCRLFISKIYNSLDVHTASETEMLICCLSLAISMRPHPAPSTL